MLGGDRMKLDYVLKFEDFLERRLHTEVRISSWRLVLT
jgi:hypothetical protein